MTEYEEFQQVMTELNYKIQMEENRKKGKSYDLPPGFEELFGGFKK